MHSAFWRADVVYVPHKKVIYRGADIYTKQGIEKFAEDFEAVKGYL
jgi:hypothetical protein